MNKVVDNEYDCGCLTGRDVDSGAAFVRHCTAHFDEVRERVEDLIFDLVFGYDPTWDTPSDLSDRIAQSVLLHLE